MKDFASRVFIGSLSCFIAFSNVVNASEKGTFSTSVGTQITYDDNLYKINKDSELIRQLLTEYDLSDKVSSVFVSGQMNWDVSEQNLLADITFRDNKYANNTQLDNIAKAYSAKWNWYASRRFTGFLSYKNDTQLANFTDNLEAALLASKNQNDTSEIAMYWQLHSRWKTRISASESTTDYSGESLALNNKNTIHSQAELIFESEAKNSFSLLLSQRNIEYENRLYVEGDTTDDEYRLSTVVLSSNYQLSEKSRITAQVKLRKLTPENITSAQDSDFSNWGFNVNYNWQPTMSTQLNATLVDEITPSQNINTDFQRSRIARFSALWQVLNKVYLEFEGEYIKRQFEYNTNTTNELDIAAKNTYRNASVSLVYTANEIIELQIGYHFNNRRSNRLARNFDSNTTYASIVARF